MNLLQDLSNTCKHVVIRLLREHRSVYAPNIGKLECLLHAVIVSVGNVDGICAHGLLVLFVVPAASLPRATRILT